MRGAVLQLHWWGLLPRVIAAGTPAVRSTTFHLPGAVTTVEIKPRDGVDALYAPRRVVLDAILADAAGRAGADVRFGTSVTGLRHDRSGRVTGITAGRPGAPGDQRQPGRRRRRPPFDHRAVRRRRGRPRRPGLERRHLPVFPRPCDHGLPLALRRRGRGRRHSHQRRADLRVRRHQRAAPAARARRRRRRRVPARPGQAAPDLADRLARGAEAVPRGYSPA